MKVAQLCLTFCDSIECSLPGFSLWNSPGKNIGVGCHFFLQEIFLTQWSNSGLLHCRQILYCLSHQGNPKVRIIFPKLKIWSWSIAFFPSPPLLSLQPFHCLVCRMRTRDGRQSPWDSLSAFLHHTFCTCTLSWLTGPWSRPAVPNLAPDLTST